MKTLNKTSAAVLDRLTDGLNNPGDHRKIDNTDGAFMPVVIECVGKHTVQNGGPVVLTDAVEFSVCHYGEQNGDLMRDPEMTFLRVNGYYFPAYFRNDYAGIEQFSIWQEDNLWYNIKSLQRDHAEFANTWMKNIQQQQGI